MSYVRAYVKSERTGMSQDERARRMKSLGQALQSRVSLEDLRGRGFTQREIDDARTFWKIERREYRRGIVHRP